MNTEQHLPGGYEQPTPAKKPPHKESWCDTLCATMPIRSVTHLNSYSDAMTHATELCIPKCFAKLVAGDDTNKEIKGFARNPEIVKEERDKMQATLEHARSALDEPGRIIVAEEVKTQANPQFSKGNTRVALVGYLLGVWSLRRGSSSCPSLVAHCLASVTAEGTEFNFQLAKAAAWLRTPIVVRADEHNCDEVDAAIALRTSLHLNVAAAALKLSEFDLARAACELVLAIDEANGKALFRLAKAMEGEGEVKAAIATITPLVKREPQNVEARRLHDELRRRHTEDKGAFKGMFSETEAAPSATEPVTAQRAPLATSPPVKPRMPMSSKARAAAQVASSALGGDW